MPFTGRRTEPSGFLLSMITDDTNGFLPLQPVSVSASGEFAAILPSEEVVSWFEDNAGETDIPAEVAALKKVGEEDNPVVVIME